MIITYGRSRMPGVDGSDAVTGTRPNKVRRVVINITRALGSVAQRIQRANEANDVGAGKNNDARNVDEVGRIPNLERQAAWRSRC